MKCLLVADLHYSLPQLDWVSLAAKKFDLAIIAGDLLDIASSVDLDTQILVVLKYLKRIQPKEHLLVSSGNHDTNQRDANDEGIATWLQKAREPGTLIDGDRFTKDSVMFSICPWWDGPTAKSRLAEQLKRDAAERPEKWIWVYHSPPQGTRTSWTGKQHFGDEALCEWIAEYQPDIVLSGHVHQAPFRNGGSWVEQMGDTIIFNTGRQLGAPPAFIALDTDANTACWFSQMANELIHLERPDEKIDLAAG